MKLALILFLAALLLGCKPTTSAPVSTSTKPAPTMDSVARIEAKDLEKAMTCLAKNGIMAATDSDGNPQPHIYVKPTELAKAKSLLKDDSQAKGYKISEL